MSDAGRVIAGSARGIRLVAPGSATRPLGDRVKQTLFAILEPRLRGAVVLDLFAGSGAGGIEALSRGAARAVFVERDGGATRVIAQNADRAHVAARARIVRADVLGYLRAEAALDGPFDVLLVDPPYAETDLLAAALERLGDPAAALLSETAAVVAKHFWRTPPPSRAGLLASERERRFGETALTFYGVGGAAPESDPPKGGGEEVPQDASEEVRS